MSENGQITWANETRKLRDLVPWEHNPREIHEKEAERLGESLELFGQIQTIAIGPDNTIYDGHQRRLVWSVLPKFGPDYEVDVRVSSRPLTEREQQQLVVYLHRGTNAAWDWDELANSLDVGDLLDWGFKNWEFGIVDAEPYQDFSDLDQELADLEGMEEIDIRITVPAMHQGTVIDWLANGESLTSPGMGKGVLRRCGLL